MSSKPAKPSFNNTQFDSFMYPLYMAPHDELHAAAAATEPSAATPDHSFFSRANVEDVQAAAGGGGLGISFAERFKRWSFEQERGMPNSDLQSYTMSPLLAANNDHSLLSSSAAGAAGRGGCATSDMRETADGRHVNLLGSLGSSEGEGINVGFLPLSNSNAPFPEDGYASTNKPQYGTTHTDMEILRVNQAHNTGSGSVQLFENNPLSSLNHQSVGLSAASSYTLPYSNTTQRDLSTSTFSNVNHSNNHQSHLLADQHHHHQWGHALRTSPAGTHPHAELLLLPGVAESVVEASSSPANRSAALPGSKLDLLHASSLHDKQTPPMLPLSVTGGGGRLSSAAQMWHVDKLDMAVGLGLHDNHVRTTMPVPDIDHYASARGATAGLCLFLQSPQQRAQTALSLDAARYSTRSASGSLGVLRNSKYLKAAQQLLNEFCNVCRDGSSVPTDAKSGNMAATSMSQNMWNVPGGGSLEEINVSGGEDHAQLSRGFFSPATTAAAQKSNLYQLKGTSGASSNQQEKTTTHMSTPDHTAFGAPPKQLPADERCHLQMRKARLIAMVEELDRRYQQYRDQMQLIVTSFESATGMGGAAPYTTLAKRAMSRQFRGLRDAIGEHIRAVCRMLGEEVSSVPILSRGETPRLRLVDQRLRHQRSLQQIGMLPQQQAWRPQRGLPERSVSVLRAWLFEHFLHPYPKDSEKSMLARLTGLSRNQVSNWFINARVRLWKPMIEEMYIEESKALEMQGEDSSEEAAPNLAGAAAGGDNNGGDSMLLLQAEEEQQRQQDSAPSEAQAILSWQQYAGAPTHYSNTPSAATNDLNSFIHFHSSSRANDHPPPLAEPPPHPFSWMKPHEPAAAAHAGDIGILTHTSNHHNMSTMQAAALMQGHGHLSSTTSNFMKNGVSLTLGLQQPPPQSSYNSSTAAQAYHGRPSEALLF